MTATALRKPAANAGLYPGSGSALRARWRNTSQPSCPEAKTPRPRPEAGQAAEANEEARLKRAGNTEGIAASAQEPDTARLAGDAGGASRKRRPPALERELQRSRRRVSGDQLSAAGNRRLSEFGSRAVQPDQRRRVLLSKVRGHVSPACQSRRAARLQERACLRGHWLHRLMINQCPACAVEHPVAVVKI